MRKCSPAPGNFRQRVADNLTSSANYLSDHPAALELLGEELTADSDLTNAFGLARLDNDRAFREAMPKDAPFVEPTNRRLIIILNAALNYLAMRSRHSPNFMGLRLDTDEGWNEALDMMRDIVMLSGRDENEET